ncbi:MAG: hypothetical protein DHS20C01_01480 [marine bacterium B5-7]|nr:MAG: hypothetical protein DHS20C01_01480 [marine bacterium B5-7]
MTRLVAYSAAFLICLFVVLTTDIIPLAHAQQAAVLSESNSSNFENLSIPKRMSANEVDGYLAPMTDSEVRQMLRSELVSETENTDPVADNSSSLLVLILGGLQDISIRFQNELDRVIEAANDAADAYHIMLRNLTDDTGWSTVIKTFGLFLIMIAIAAVLERAYLRLLSRSKSTRLKINESDYKSAVDVGDDPGADSSNDKSRVEKPGLLSTLSRSGLAITALALFTVAAYVLSLVFFERFDPLRVLTTTWLFIVVVIRFARIVLDTILPGAHGSAFLHLPETTGKTLCLSVLVYVGLAAILFFHGSLFVILGMDEYLHRTYILASGWLLYVLAIYITWRSRYDVALLWRMNGQGNDVNDASSSGTGWHTRAMLLLTMATVLWSMNIVLGRGDSASAAIWFVVSIALIYVGRLVVGAMSVYTRNHPRDTSALSHARGHLKVPRIALTTALSILAGVFLLESLSGRIYALLDTEGGSLLLMSTFNISVTIVIAWVLWELIRASIDRYLPDDVEGASIDAFDGEGGESAPASRAETLLPLLRRFLQIVLVMLVSLTVLSSLGVDIGPLLAGAGVVGLAVGFGAQKLVQDVISGIFFLVDDAFRTGEYIETADMRGTVERISVRSLRLRHHLGPVQTIPYSEMATVKNHSRDYIIMKLPFRLPYDTDIENVRKIIKKIGQDMMADPELGPGFLSPLKSQGVLQMEDSAMVLRMKFTAKPGEQWVIRREAYRRVRDALREEGIEFAHRQITVHIPKEDQANDQALINKHAIGAAAIDAEEPSSEASDTDSR